MPDSLSTHVPTSPCHQAAIAYIHDGRGQFQRHALHGQSELVMIGSEIQRLPAVDATLSASQPMQGNRGIAPRVLHVRQIAVFLKRHLIVAMIDIQQQTIRLVSLIQECGVDIIEGIVDGLTVCLQPLTIQHVQIRTTRREGERHLRTQRHTQCPLRRDESNGGLTAEMLGNRISQQHGQLTTQHIGRCRRHRHLCQPHRRIVAAIKDREETEQVADIIDGHTCYGHTTMRMVTSLDVDTATELIVGLHAWQHLRKMDRVGITQNLGHVVHHAQIPFNAAVGLLLDRRRIATATNGDAIQRKTPRRRFLC